MECLLSIHYQWRCKRDMTISLYVSIIVLYLTHVSEIIIGVPCGRSKHLEVANQSSPLPGNSTTLRPMAVLPSYTASPRNVQQSYSSSRRRRVVTLKDSQGYLSLHIKDNPLAIRRSSLHHGMLSLSSASSSKISKLRHAHTSRDVNVRGELRHDTSKHKSKRQVNRRLLKDPFLNHKVKRSLTNQDNYFLNFSLPDSFFTPSQGLNQIIGSDYNRSVHPYESSERTSENYGMKYVASNTNSLEVKKSESEYQLKNASWMDDAASMLAASIALANISTDSLPTVGIDTLNKSWFQAIMNLTQPTLIENLPTNESSKSTKMKLESTSEQQTTLFNIDQKAIAPLQRQNIKNGDYDSVTNLQTNYLSFKIEEKSKPYTEQPITNEIESLQDIFKGNTSFEVHPSTTNQGYFVSLANSCVAPENNNPLTPNTDLLLSSDLKPELQKLCPDPVETYPAVINPGNHVFPSESNENIKAFENMITSFSEVNERDKTEQFPPHAYKNRSVMEIVVQGKPKADDVIKIIPYKALGCSECTDDAECSVTIIPEDKSKHFNLLNALNGKSSSVPLELQKLIEMKFDTTLSSQPVKTDTYVFLSSDFTENLMTSPDQTHRYYEITSQTPFPVGKILAFTEEEGVDMTNSIMKTFPTTNSPLLGKLSQNLILTTNPILPKSTVTPANLREMCLSYMNTMFKNDHNILAASVINQTESITTQNSTGFEKNKTLTGEGPRGQTAKPPTQTNLNVKIKSTHAPQIPYLIKIVSITSTVGQTTQFPYKNHTQNHTAHSANFTHVSKPLGQTRLPVGKLPDILTECTPKEMMGAATATDNLLSSQLTHKTTAVNSDTTSLNFFKKLFTQRIKEQHSTEKPHADISLQYQTTTFEGTAGSETASPVIQLKSNIISTTLSTVESSEKSGVQNAVDKVLKLITRSTTPSTNMSETEMISNQSPTPRIAEVINPPTQQTHSVPRTSEKLLSSFNTTHLPVVTTETHTTVKSSTKHKTGHSPQRMICFPLEASTMILPKDALNLLSEILRSTHSTSESAESTTFAEKHGPLDLLTKIFVITHSTSISEEGTTTTEKLGPLDLLTKMFVITHSTSALEQSTTTTEKPGPLDLLTKMFVITHSTSALEQSTNTTEKPGPLDLLTKIFVTKHVDKTDTNITTTTFLSSDMEKGEHFRPTKGFMAKPFNETTLYSKASTVPTNTTKSTRGIPKKLMQVQKIFLTSKSTSLARQEKQNLRAESTMTTRLSEDTAGAPKSSIGDDKEEQFRPTLWTTKGYTIRKVSKTTVASTVSTMTTHKTTGLPKYAKIKSSITRGREQEQNESPTHPSHFNSTKFVAKITKLLTSASKLSPQTHKEEHILTTRLTTTTYLRKDISQSPKQVQMEEEIRPKYPTVSTFTATNITKAIKGSRTFAVKTTVRFTADALRSSDRIQKEEDKRPTRTVLTTTKISKTPGSTAKLAVQANKQSEDRESQMKTAAAFSPNISKTTEPIFQFEEEEEDELSLLKTTPKAATIPGTGTSRITEQSPAEQQNHPTNFSLFTFPHNDVSKSRTDIPEVVPPKVEQQITETYPPSTVGNRKLTTGISQITENVKAERTMRSQYLTKISLQGKFATGASKLAVQENLEEQHGFKNNMETTCLLINTVTCSPRFSNDVQVEYETNLREFQITSSIPTDNSAPRFVAGRQICKTLSDEDLLPGFIEEYMGTDNDPPGEGLWFTYDSSRENLTTDFPVGIGNSNIPDKFAFHFSSRDVNLPTECQTDSPAGRWFSQNIIEEFRTENLQEDVITALRTQGYVMMNENPTNEDAHTDNEEATDESNNDLINQTLTTECLPKVMVSALTASSNVVTDKLTKNMINKSLTTECLPKVMVNVISPHAETKHQSTNDMNNKRSTTKYPPKQMTKKEQHQLEDPSNTSTTEYVLTEMTAPFTVRTLSGVFFSHVCKTKSSLPKVKSRVQGEIENFRFMNNEGKTTKRVSICPTKKSRGRSKTTDNYDSLLLVPRVQCNNQSTLQTTTICPRNSVIPKTDQPLTSECLPKEMTGFNNVQKDVVHRITQETKSTSCLPKQMAETFRLSEEKESTTECLPKVMVGALTSSTGVSHGKKSTSECLPNIMAGALTDAVAMAHAKMHGEKSTTECLPKAMAWALKKTYEKKSTTECLYKVMVGKLTASTKVRHSKIHENKSTIECSPKGMARTLTRPMEEAHRFTDECKSTTSCKAMATSVTTPVEEFHGFIYQYPSTMSSSLPTLKAMKDTHGSTPERKTISSDLPELKAVAYTVPVKRTHGITATSYLPKGMAASTTASVKKGRKFTRKAHSSTPYPQRIIIAPAEAPVEEHVLTQEKKLKTGPKEMACEHIATLGEVDTDTQITKSTTMSCKRIKGSSLRPSVGDSYRITPKKSTMSHLPKELAIAQTSVLGKSIQVVEKKSTILTFPREMSAANVGIEGQKTSYTTSCLPNTMASALSPPVEEAHGLAAQHKTTTECLPKIMEGALTAQTVQGQVTAVTECLPKVFAEALKAHTPELCGISVQHKATTECIPKEMAGALTAPSGQTQQGNPMQYQATTECIPKEMAGALTASTGQTQQGNPMQYQATTTCLPKEMARALTAPTGQTQQRNQMQYQATTECIPKEMAGALTAPTGQTQQGNPMQYQATTECLPKEMAGALTALTGQTQQRNQMQYQATKECLPKEMAGALTAPTGQTQQGNPMQYQATTECLPKEMGGALTAPTGQTQQGNPMQYQATIACLPKEMAGALTAPTGQTQQGNPMQYQATIACLPKEMGGALTAPTGQTQQGNPMQYQATIACLPKEMAGALTVPTGQTQQGNPMQYQATTTCLPKEMAGALTAPTGETQQGNAMQYQATTECLPKEMAGALTTGSSETPGFPVQQNVITECLTKKMAEALTASTEGAHGLSTQHMTTTECLPLVMASQLTAPMVHGPTCQKNTTTPRTKIPVRQTEETKLRFIYKTKVSTSEAVPTSVTKGCGGKAGKARTEIVPQVSHATEKVESSAECSSKVAASAETEGAELRFTYISTKIPRRKILVSKHKSGQGKKGRNSKMEAKHQTTNNNVCFQSNECTSEAESNADTAQEEIVHGIIQGGRNGNLKMESLPQEITDVHMGQPDAAVGLKVKMRQGSSTTECLSTDNTERAEFRLIYKSEIKPTQSVPNLGAMTSRNNVVFCKPPETTVMKAMLLEDEVKSYANKVEAAHQSEKPAGRFGVKLLGTLFKQTEPRTLPIEGQELTTTSIRMLKKRSVEQTESSSRYDRESNSVLNGIWKPHFLKKPDR